MPMLTSLALSVALLAATTGLPEGSSEDLTQAQAFTMVANVLGAATACGEIPHDRVAAAARQVATLATARAVSDDDFASAERLLMVSAAAGRQAIDQGLTDCPTVDAAFSQVEQMVLQTPVRLRREEPVRPATRRLATAS